MPQIQVPQIPRESRTVHLVGQRPSMPLASDSGPSRFSFISPSGENFMRETISFAVSIVSDNNLQFFVVSFTLKDVRAKFF